MSSDNEPPTTLGGGGITFTRKRNTLAKTRTAASSARRRKNISVCHATGGGGGGGDDDVKDGRNSWFARKAATWTDGEIRSRLNGGGESGGGEAFSMVGDVILGVDDKKSKRKRKRRVGGVKFAWEENEEDEGGDNYSKSQSSSMPAAPTLADIMDEQDEIDFMSPLKVGAQFQTMKQSTATDDDEKGTDNDNDPKKGKGDSKHRIRRQNAALAELAAVSGMDHTSSRTNPTSTNESIGWRLLRVLGYRARLGIAYVPLSGHSGQDGNDDELMKQLEQQNKKPTHEAKWLASKKLRAIRLPSIQQTGDTRMDKLSSKDKLSDKDKSSIVLRIPPPKINRHGLGYDPFRNAPEFRAFHERRRELARKRGRQAAEGNAEEGGGRGEEGASVKKDRYFTDNLKRDGRMGLWDKSGGRARRSDDDDEEEEDDHAAIYSGKGTGQQQHSHYAADRDYTDFIGTKASSGFALEDEDDADVYGGHAAFPGHGGEEHDHGDDGEYAMEIQSPPTSEDENDGALSLFGKSAITGGAGRKRKLPESNGAPNKLEGAAISEAWSAWGTGTEDTTGVAKKMTTMDGKPPLPGFALGQGKFSSCGNSSNTSGSDVKADPDAPKRWKGPVPPSGYILKRHAFSSDENSAIDDSRSAMAMDGITDTGLGLDLQHSHHQQHVGTASSSRKAVPKVLPPSSQHPPPPHGKMLAKDGTELNFHAVRESMKSRFTTSSSAKTVETNDLDTENKSSGGDGQKNLDKEEWLQVVVTPWMPTRLLCKRWGVAVPTGAGMPPGASSDGGSMGGRVGPSKEEDYFRTTVYEPAAVMAEQRQNDNTDGDDTKTRPKGSKLAQIGSSQATIEDGGNVSYYDEQDASNQQPPPTRPSAEVFRSIFDAEDESDMDISSSSSEDEYDGLEGSDAKKPADEMRSKLSNHLEGDEHMDQSEKAAPNRTFPTNGSKIHLIGHVVDNNKHDEASEDGSASSRSQSSRRRRERRRNWRRQDHADENGEDDDEDDRKKRKRKEKHRRRHHDRREDYLSSSIESEDGDDGADRSDGDNEHGRRRKSKKKNKHRSRSRHHHSKSRSRSRHRKSRHDS